MSVVVCVNRRPVVVVRDSKRASDIRSPEDI